jgi:hypothetical protein
MGGGIKDVWVADGRDATGLRARVVEGLAQEPDVVVEDVDVAEAARVLLDAVACPPCPVDPEQVDDVITHLALARSRAVHLARLAGIGDANADGTATGTGSAEVVQLRVSLRGIRPPIWRRLEVPADITLHRLHRALQVAFGWDDAHLHRFETATAGHVAGLRTS